MATHSSTLAWKIPWTEEPGRLLQSMGLLKLDMTERLHFDFSLSCTGEGNGNPLQCSYLENPRDGGAWWAAIYGVTQSQILLKWPSRSIYNLTIDPENFHNHLWISRHLWPSLLQALSEVHQESQSGSWYSSISINCPIPPFLPCFWRWRQCKVKKADFAATIHLSLNPQL